MNPVELWRERSRNYWNEAIRYIRLMANGGLAIAVYGTLLMIGFYYQSFLEWLPAGFPVLLVLTILFAFLLTRSPVRTFVKEGDLVFLLPFEGQMGPYIRKAIVYSWLWQGAILFLILFLLAPLYLDRLPGELTALVVTMAVLVAAQLWNIVAEWTEIRQQFSAAHSRHRWLRFVVNVVFVYFLLQTAWWFAAVIALIMLAVMVLYYRPMHYNHPLKWETLIAREQQRLHSFYRLANAFTDVRHVKSTVHRRRWLAAPFERIRHQKANTYIYLYGKTFARSGDYLGICIRLAVVGALLIYAAPAAWDWMVLVVVGLFIYMTGAQMATIYNHHDVLLWPSIYPVPDMSRRRAVKSMVRWVLLVQTFWFAVITALTSVPMIMAALALLVGVAISLYYSEFQLNKYFDA
ncbi:ABC-2 type transport system permease protein [Geomicrobium halophilum]|uniref:ABC-2 type transport system permease protein n=1 Tax=Geomicrobium halophilum TaxID=549000 RepID=A0A841PYQ3_9BACL|nr:ABC transporter permease [Geomicrobium halophilum]MBB6449532.1 ABC-2 type transport system permease protein [Geomicrobium halophilum]